jgi:hypothetical protein
MTKVLAVAALLTLAAGCAQDMHGGSMKDDGMMKHDSSMKHDGMMKKDDMMKK